MNHVMLDLETLGVGDDAAIVSIGAVRFDLHSEKLGPEFEAKIEFSPSAGKIEPGTVKWWLEQPKEAQEALLSGERISLADAIRGFNSFLKASPVEGFWSNGPTFDERLINQAASRCKKRLDYPFRASRCMRTYAMLGRDRGVSLSRIQNPLQHDALQDAIYQARVVQAIHADIMGT